MGISLKNWMVGILALGAFLFLCGLGTWQVQRLHWKEALIAQTKNRTQQEPLDLVAAEARWHADQDVDYLPVKLSGIFQHELELYYYNTLKGTVGWNVFTPLVLEDGRKLLVNRGFVPEQFRSPDTRTNYLFPGPQQFTGLARNPLFEKPNQFVPDNDLSARSFYWKSYPQMVTLAGGAGNVMFLPFFVDAGPVNIEGALPVGGTTRISFPNNHLQYAITWYGLAGALLMVGGFYWNSVRRKQSQTSG